MQSCCGVVVITNAQFHSKKPELRFCAGSNHACAVSEILVVITTAQLHSTKPELRFCTGSNPAACQRLAVVSISDNGLG